MNRQTLNLLIYTLAGLGWQSSSFYLPAHMRWFHLKAASSTAGAEVGQQETGKIATAGNVALFFSCNCRLLEIDLRYKNVFSLTLILLLFICKQSWATRNRQDCRNRERCRFFMGNYGDLDPIHTEDIEIGKTGKGAISSCNCRLL